MHTTIPQLGLGTFRLKEQQAIDAVATGLELGYRHIDTAQIYGNEAEVGQALAGSGVARGDVFVTTKIWTEHLAAHRLRASLEESLVKLRTDYVDLTLIHWPSPGAAVSVAESMEALLAARESGLTRRSSRSSASMSAMSCRDRIRSRARRLLSRFARFVDDGITA